jgi:low temperature requirement protein LtrA
VPAPERFWIWRIAFAIDLGTRWLAVGHIVKIPPDAAHLPERFGLFTLILLGESVVAVMRGMESQEDLAPSATTSAFLGMGISFLIWWWYFDGASGASEQPIRTKRGRPSLSRLELFAFPTSLGIVIVGVGIQRIVTAASRATLTTILTGATTVVMVAMSLIGAASPGHRRRISSSISRSMALALAMLVVGYIVSGFGSPVAMVVVIAGLSVAQLAVALSGTLPPRSNAHLAAATQQGACQGRHAAHRR